MLVMARGWESKAVEAQMEAATAGSQPKPTSTETPEQTRRRQERSSLELSRTRVLKDIETSTNTRYRAILEAALRHLDDKIKALGD